MPRSRPRARPGPTAPARDRLQDPRIEGGRGLGRESARVGGAHLGGRVGIAEVVEQLEGLSERLAEPAQTREDRVVGAGQGGTDEQRTDHRVRPALQVREASGVRIGVGQIEELSGRHLEPHPVVRLERRRQAFG